MLHAFDLAPRKVRAFPALLPLSPEYVWPRRLGRLHCFGKVRSFDVHVLVKVQYFDVLQ